MMIGDALQLCDFSLIKERATVAGIGPSKGMPLNRGEIGGAAPRARTKARLPGWVQGGQEGALFGTPSRCVRHSVPVARAGWATPAR